MGSDFEGFFFLFNCYWIIDHPMRLSSLQGLNFIPPLGHFTEASLMKSSECASTPAKGFPEPVLPYVVGCLD